MKVIAIVKLKRRINNTCIFDIVIGKFSYLEEPNLIILLLVNNKNLT